MTQTHQHTAAPPAPPLMAGWMTRFELARELSVSVDTLRRWDDQRKGPACIRAGRTIYYRRSVVLDWLEKQETTKRSKGKGHR